eukprot:532323-Lingulodinium_polyedra.AAC.1
MALHRLGQGGVQLREVAGEEGTPGIDRAEEVPHPHAGHAGAIEEGQERNGPRRLPLVVRDRGR